MNSLTIRRNMVRSLISANRMMESKASTQCAAVKRVGHNVSASPPRMTAGMRRIFEQYKSGTYDPNMFSTRAGQRHRKYFLETTGLDLRKPYRPTTSPSPSVLEFRTRQLTKSLRASKKVMKHMPEPEPVPEPPKMPICRKSKCASDAFSRARKTRVQQRKTGGTIGLGAMARLTR